MRPYPAADTLIHMWHRCNGCGAEPIVGGRYDCQTCPAGPDGSLCEPCYASYRQGELVHPSPDSYAALSSAPLGTPHQFVHRRGAPSADVERWLGTPDCGELAPTVQNGFVVRPEFHIAGASFFGSYATVGQVGRTGAMLVITALHVMDELCRAVKVDCSVTSDSYTGQELPQVVTHVELYDAFASNWMRARVGSAQSMMVLPEARTGEEEPYCQRDLAAFHVEASPTLAPRPLADAAPDVGEPVWLVTRPVRGSTHQGVAGVVVEQTGRALVFRITPGGEVPRYASGAPIINRRGEIVGINIGAGWFVARRFGHAIHAKSIRRHLGVM